MDDEIYSTRCIKPTAEKSTVELEGKPNDEVEITGIKLPNSSTK